MTEESLNVSVVKQMLVELRDAGFKGEIVIEYNGSGDSGDFYAPELGDRPALKGAIEALGYKFEYQPHGNWNHGKQQYEYPEFDPKHCLLGVLIRLLPGGWEINEGSSGEVVLDIIEATVTVKHNANVMTTEYSEDTY